MTEDEEDLTLTYRALEVGAAAVGLLEARVHKLEAENQRLRAALADTLENIDFVDRIILDHEMELETVAAIKVLEGLRARAGIEEGGRASDAAGAEHDMNLQLRAHGMGQESGAADTRASIVAWLRRDAKVDHEPDAEYALGVAADAIERGDDLHKEEK